MQNQLSSPARTPALHAGLALRSADSDAPLSRRESVWRACDELARRNIKPTLSKLSGLHRGGSDTDVHEDIQLWFADVFRRHLDVTAGKGLPNEVAALMRGLWDSAVSAASAQLDVEREELRRREADAVAAVEAASASEQEARDEASELKALLAAERERSVALDAKSTELAAALEQEKRESAHWRDRGEALAREMTELTRRATEEAAAARVARDDEIKRITAEHQQRVADFQAQATLSEERTRAVENRMMTEIDRARQSVVELREQLKAARQRLDEERTMADAQRQSLEARLASSRESLAEIKGARSALEAQLADQVERLRSMAQERDQALRSVAALETKLENCINDSSADSTGTEPGARKG